MFVVMSDAISMIENTFCLEPWQCGYWWLPSSLPPRLPVQLSDLCLSPLFTSSSPDGDYSEQSQFVFIYFSRTQHWSSLPRSGEFLSWPGTGHRAGQLLTLGLLGWRIYLIKLDREVTVTEHGKGWPRKKILNAQYLVCSKFIKLCQIKDILVRLLSAVTRGRVENSLILLWFLPIPHCR